MGSTAVLRRAEGSRCRRQRSAPYDSPGTRALLFWANQLRLMWRSGRSTHHGHEKRLRKIRGIVQREPPEHARAKICAVALPVLR